MRIYKRYFILFIAAELFQNVPIAKKLERVERTSSDQLANRHYLPSLCFSITQKKLSFDVSLSLNDSNLVAQSTLIKKIAYTVKIIRLTKLNVNFKVDEKQFSGPNDKINIENLKNGYYLIEVYLLQNRYI